MRQGLIMLFAAAVAIAPAAAEDLETEARERVLGFNAAYAANQLDDYFAYYADDATQWWPQGRVSLADYKKQWYALIAGGGGVEKNDVTDLQVRLSPGGNVAIATYRVSVVTRQADGSRSSEHAQETDVWFRLAGVWKVVHLHYQSVPAQAKPE